MYMRVQKKMSSPRLTIKGYVALAKKLKADKRVPKISKILFGAAIGYFFMPFDIIPDFIPVIGHLDDIIIIPLLFFLAVIFIPRDIYRENYAQAINETSDTI